MSGIDEQEIPEYLREEFLKWGKQRTTDLLDLFYATSFGLNKVDWTDKKYMRLFNLFKADLD